MDDQGIHLKDIFCSLGSLGLKLRKLLDWGPGTLLAWLMSGRRQRPRPEQKPQKILIIRPGGIGDAIFLLPILKELKAQDPALTIDILGEKRNAQVFLSQRSLCDHVYLYDNFASFRSVFRNRYDIVIDTEQWHYLSAVIARSIPASCTAGFATRPLRKKLFDAICPYQADAYELDNFKALFRFLHNEEFHTPDIHNTYRVSPDIMSWAQKVTPRAQVTFFLGGSIALRRLSHEKSCAIIRHLLDNGLTVALLGGGDVLLSSQKIEEDIHDARLVNYVAKISLEQSAALIRESKLFIGTDSGLVHLACAVGTPVIAIFGPGNIKKWGPRGEKHARISLYLDCSPCTKFGYTVPTCQGRYPCMNNIEVSEICRAADRFINP